MGDSMKSLMLLLCVVLVGCGSDENEAGTSGEGKVVVTANWLDGTLSIADADTLVGATDRQSVETASIDLSGHAPGPLEVEITPDGKTALVAISAGFFSLPFAGGIVNAGTIPAGTGGLVFVDLESRAVLGELATGSHPMGIRITKDSKRAIVAHFGSNDLVLVDIEARTVIDSVAIGIYGEEIAFDDTESVGIVGFSDDGSSRTFSFDETSITLSEPLSGPGDSAGVAFFPGTKLAFVLQAANGITNMESGYTLVDASDPLAPVVLSDVRWPEATMGYGITAHSSRGSVIIPQTENGRLTLREYALNDASDDVTLVKKVDVTDATLMGARAVTVDGQGRVLCAVPRERVLTVTDLDTETSTVIPWADNAGPTDVAVW